VPRAPRRIPGSEGGPDEVAPPRDDFSPVIGDFSSCAEASLRNGGFGAERHERNPRPGASSP